MSEERRCLVIDGHPTLRMGIRGLLSDRYEIEEAANGDDGLDLVTSLGDFDVAIVELGRTNGDRLAGLRAIRALRDARPGLGIVAHATHAERHAASEALEAGAIAYVAKSSSVEALADAVEAAAHAERFVDPAAGGVGGAGLTRRQREILQLLADGQSTTEVAHTLGLSTETVRTHTKAALARLGAHDRAHAVAIALRAGLIE
ncbi:MAG TPA: response regulator transcription factor [Solirubrobacterales bacterium]|nr:response regulator transcription factor [Solirubrobacterales bacterium]